MSPVKYFTDRSKAKTSFALCLVFLMLSCLFIAALWSPAGKGLTSWLFLVMFIVFLSLFHVVFCLIVSFPDLCRLSYLVNYTTA